MAVPKFKTGDTWTPISGTVVDASGNPVNISSATSLRFVAKLQSGAAVIRGTATKLDVDVSTRGTWSYTWVASDLSIPGTYESELEVTWPTGKVETFPADKSDNPTFVVSADLD